MRNGASRKLGKRLSQGRRETIRIKKPAPAPGRTCEDLEIQNESLRQAQLELETDRDHYAELLETAPVCFVTLTRSGLIREINLLGVQLLSPRHNHLIGWPFVSFIAKADKKAFLAHLSRCRDSSDPTRPMSVELQLARGTGERPAFIELVSIPVREKVRRPSF